MNLTSTRLVTERELIGNANNGKRRSNVCLAALV